MNDSTPRSADARSRANALFDKKTQRDLEILEQQRQLQRRETEKLLRLRSLRLAKEATDKEVQASEPMRRSRSQSKRTRQPKP